MEEKLDLILEKLERLEYKLTNVKDDTIKEFLNDNTRDNFIGVNVNMIYEAYKNVTGGNATKNELSRAIKKQFNLRLRHTTKNRENIYYWGE